MDYKQPTAVELGRAAVDISEILLESYKRLNAQLAQTTASRRNGGLLDVTPASKPLGIDLDPHHVYANASERIKGIPAVAWLYRHGSFQRLKKSIQRRAKAAPSSKFADWDAEWKLIECVLVALYVARWYRERRLNPGEMTQSDWDSAIRAINTLAHLQRVKGLNISSVLHGTSLLNGLSPNWDKEALARLNKARVDAPKPCQDSRVAERKALKRFAQALLEAFGQAPALMVEEFGDLINYRPGSIKRNVSKWIVEPPDHPIVL